MAEIILNADIQTKNATTQLNKLIDSIQKIGTELNKIQSNKLDFDKVCQGIEKVATSLTKLHSSLKSTESTATAASTASAGLGNTVASIVSVFSLMTEIISYFEQKEDEIHQKIIDTGIAAIDQIAKLISLKSELQATTAGTAEFDEVSSRLVETLSLTADAFSSTKNDAEAYKNELLELTDAQLLVRRGEIQAAIDAAKEKLNISNKALSFHCFSLFCLCYLQTI